MGVFYRYEIWNEPNKLNNKHSMSKCDSIIVLHYGKCTLRSINTFKLIKHSVQDLEQNNKVIETRWKNNKGKGRNKWNREKQKRLFKNF